jgi:hypothetical protein
MLSTPESHSKKRRRRKTTITGAFHPVIPAVGRQKKED